jgi:hypothetical protein
MTSNSRHENKINAGIHMLCVWSGPAYIVLFLTGLLISGLFPPPSPSLTASEIANIYATQTNAIRFGMLIAFMASVFYLPFCIAISQQLRRIEGKYAILAEVHSTMAVISLFTQWFPPLLMLSAAFRPERAPEITQYVNDLAWILNVMTISCFMIQYLAIALAIFSDRRAEPILPRWVAFLNLWVILVFLPGETLAFVHRGPFAWQGLLSFYAGLVAYSLWFWAMFFALRQAIKKLAREQSDVDDVAQEVPA